MYVCSTMFPEPVVYHKRQTGSELLFGECLLIDFQWYWKSGTVEVKFFVFILEMLCMDMTITVFPSPIHFLITPRNKKKKKKKKK